MVYAAEVVVHYGRMEHLVSCVKIIYS